MADEDKEDKTEVDGEDDEAASKKGGKKLLIIIAAVVVLLVGGVAAAYFLGFLDPVVEMVTGGGGETIEEEEEDPEAPKETVFYDLQEILVNLNDGGGKSRFLKIRVSLELESQTAIKKIEKIMPRVVDSFQTFLQVGKYSCLAHRTPNI